MTRDTKSNTLKNITPHTNILEIYEGYAKNLFGLFRERKVKIFIMQNRWTGEVFKVKIKLPIQSEKVFPRRTK